MVLAAGVFAFSSGIARWLCVHQTVRSGDDLDWLKQEFKLSATDLDRVRKLHEGYLPKCREFCVRIEAKKGELDQLLGNGNGVTTAVEDKLREIAVLRADCQAAMLRHFQEVSAAMPKEQGQRYLREMQQLTLGQHQEFEKSMSPSSSPHGHH
ncbi:MAG: periplasmic heavy metal sensor [Verrucomicrobiota bacterium]